jgi:uncharacterized glyoxalase superfamily protein PhnB
MIRAQAMSNAQLLRCAPYFPVADVATTAGHYREVFGFNVEYIAGEPPQFAIVTRDGLALMLRHVDDPQKITPNERQGGTWDAFFWVRSARMLCDELRANGAEIVYGPVVQEYGITEFAARDRDGHVLGFGERLA